MNVYVILRDFETVESLPWNQSEILDVFNNRNACIKYFKSLIKGIKEIGYKEINGSKCIYKEIAVNGMYSVILQKNDFKIMYRIKKEYVNKEIPVLPY
jgi:hypothetical protein